MKKTNWIWIAIAAAIVLFFVFAGDSGSSSNSYDSGSSYDRRYDQIGDAYGMDGKDVKDQIDGYVSRL